MRKNVVLVDSSLLLISNRLGRLKAGFKFVTLRVINSSTLIIAGAFIISFQGISMG